MSKTTEALACKRFQRAMQQHRAAMMELHLDLMETESGVMAMVMVSGIAQLVAFGLESPAALADTIRLESIKSGIPVNALEAQARFSSELVTCFAFEQQQNKSPR